MGPYQVESVRQVVKKTIVNIKAKPLRMRTTILQFRQAENIGVATSKIVSKSD
jgi:hypothetical protein